MNRRQRDRRLRKTYAITADQVDTMIAMQDGNCAICGLPEKLVVDHCHTGGKVRGLLCNRCNLALGLMKDDPGLCEAMARYLRLHSRDPFVSL